MPLLNNHLAPDDVLKTNEKEFEMSIDIFVTGIEKMITKKISARKNYKFPNNIDSDAC